MGRGGAAAVGGFNGVLGPRTGSPHRGARSRRIIAERPSPVTTAEIDELIAGMERHMWDIDVPLVVLHAFRDHLGQRPLLDRLYEAQISCSLAWNKYRDDEHLAEKLRSTGIVRTMSRGVFVEKDNHERHLVEGGQAVCGLSQPLQPLVRGVWAEQLWARADLSVPTRQHKGYCQTCLDAYNAAPARFPEAQEYGWDGWCRDIGNDAWPQVCEARFRQRFRQALDRDTPLDEARLTMLEKEAYHGTCAERFAKLLADEPREAAARVLQRDLDTDEAHAADSLSIDDWTAFVRRVIETRTLSYYNELLLEVRDDLTNLLAVSARLNRAYALEL